MKVSNVNGVNQNSGVQVAKKAATVAGVVGGLDLAGKVGADVFAYKNLLKLPKDIALESFPKSADEIIAGVKDTFSQIKMPKALQNLFDKKFAPNSKAMKNLENVLNEMKQVITTGKIDYAPIVKRALKGAGVTAAVVGVACAVGFGISKAIQNKNAAKAQAEQVA